MLIISNVKDYYDYCISYYGLDKDVVYDRREYSDVKNHEFFKQTEYCGFDSYRTNINVWVKNENGKDKDNEKSPIEKKLDRLEDKINTIEDILEIEPGFAEAAEITKKELDLTPLEDKIKDSEDKDIEEEE